MAHYLPPAIMRFFQPRPPTTFKKPNKKRKMPPLHGVSQFIHRFSNEPLPVPEKQETPIEIKAKRRKKKTDNSERRVEIQAKKWTPKEEDNKNKTSDAYKTLFVGRLNFEVTDADLKDEFEYYGPITKVSIVTNKKGKSRGYGFVEFESSRDLREAYDDADGRKIVGRRILVDVERGRTVKNWRPRRLGGGLGGTRIGAESANQRFSGREPPKNATGGSSNSTSSRSSRSDRSDRDRRSRRDDRGGGGRDRERRDRDRGGDRDRDRSRRGRDKGEDRDRDRRR